MENATNNKNTIFDEALDISSVLNAALFKNAERKERDELFHRIMDGDLSNWDNVLAVFNEMYGNATDEDKKKVLDAIVQYSDYRAEIIERANLKKDYEKFGISVHKEVIPELNERRTQRDEEKAEQVKKLHKCNIQIIKNDYIRENKKWDMLYEGNDPVIKSYSDRGVKRWHEYPRTVRIGSKYLNIAQPLFDNASLKSGMSKSSATPEYVMEYIAEPRVHMEDWIHSVVSSTATKRIADAIHSRYSPGSNLVFGRNLVVSLGYSEGLVYDFWKKLTGKGDSIYFNEGCCGRGKYYDGFDSDIPEREDKIQWALYHILEWRQRYFTISVSDKEGIVHNISILDAMKKILTASGVLEPFAEEKKRYDINRAYLKYLTSLVSKDMLDYLETASLKEIEEAGGMHLEKLPEVLQPKTGTPFTITDVFNYDRFTATAYDVTDTFINEVIAPYFSTDRLFWDMEKEPGRYHLSSRVLKPNDYWDDKKHFEQLCKMIDEEDPLTKYEFSPVFQKRILDSGYDGVGFEKYSTVIFEGLNLNISVKKLLKMKLPEFTDDEKYMLGRYADQDYVLNLLAQ